MIFIDFYDTSTNFDRNFIQNPSKTVHNHRKLSKYQNYVKMDPQNRFFFIKIDKYHRITCFSMIFIDFYDMLTNFDRNFIQNLFKTVHNHRNGPKHQNYVKMNTKNWVFSIKIDKYHRITCFSMVFIDFYIQNVHISNLKFSCLRLCIWICCCGKV